MRKKDTGEPGNKGEFGHTARADSGLVLDGDDTPAPLGEVLADAGGHLVLTDFDLGDPRFVKVKVTERPDGDLTVEAYRLAPVPVEHVNVNPAYLDYLNYMAKERDLGEAVLDEETGVVHLRCRTVVGPGLPSDELVGVVERAHPEFMDDREIAGFGKAADVTGADQTPSTTQEWSARTDAAVDAFHEARERMEAASVGAVASAVRDLYPHAEYLALDYSDQGNDYWCVSEVWGDDREVIADAEDLLEGCEDVDLWLSNLRDSVDYPFIFTDPDGRNPRLSISAAWAWARGDS